MKKTGTEKVYSIFTYAVLSILLVFTIYPFVYLISTSLLGYGEWVETGGLVLLVRHPSFKAYSNLFAVGQIFTNGLLISTARTVIGVLSGLAFTLCTGYVMSRKNMPGRKMLINFLLVTVLFSGGLIPGYLIVQATGLLNSFWSLIVPGLVDAFSALVFKQFFERIPVEIEESAQMDGVGEFTLMTRILIPLSKPVIAAIAMFGAIGHWNSWFDALLYISDQWKHPMQLLLMRSFTRSSTLMANFSASKVMNVPKIATQMAITVVGMAPIVLVYPFLQKYFVKGVYAGSVKE